jgi:hypothetical protein
MGLASDIAARLGRMTTPGGQVVNCVMETIDFRRVRDLPRREWTEDPTLDRLVAALTTALKTEHGIETLRPVQAATLSELHDYRGAFVTARVGAGKTLIGALAGSELVLDAKRPMYITRGGAEASTRKALYDISAHWKIRPINLTSYSKLALDYDNKILGGYQPDLIIADESDAMANTKNGCWQIVGHYVHAMRARERAEKLPFGTLLVFLPMCGTPTDTSIRQYWHLLHAALGPERCPVPKDWSEKAGWCAALDEGVTPESRWQPGALPRLDLEAAIGASELERARNAYGSRFRKTPGIMTTGDARPPNRLHITAVDLEASPKVADMITEMRLTYRTPDGHPFEMPMELWRHARELQADFYNVWDPRPPAEWLAVRKEWHQLRDDNYGPHKRYRTPGHLVNAIVANQERNVQLVDVWNAWQAMKPTFVPNPVPVFVDDTTTNRCAEWLEQSQGGLLWVEHPDLGERLEKLTGVPFYHSHGLRKDGRSLEQHRRGFPAIASVRSCSYALNLQKIFHRNYYATPMSTNKYWEQSMGRTHRDGQTEPTVHVEVAMMVSEAYSSMVYAIRKAEMVHSTMKQGQKLVYAEVRDLSKIEALISRRNDSMWIYEIDAV